MSSLGLQGSGWLGPRFLQSGPPHTVPGSPCLSLPRGSFFLTWGTAGPGPWGAVGPQGQWEQWPGGWARRGLGTLSTRGQTMKASGTLTAGQGDVGRPPPVSGSGRGRRGGEGLSVSQRGPCCLSAQVLISACLGFTLRWGGEGRPRVRGSAEPGREGMGWRLPGAVCTGSSVAGASARGRGGLDPCPLPPRGGGGTASALTLFPSLKGGGSLQHGGGR